MCKQGQEKPRRRVVLVGFQMEPAGDAITPAYRNDMVVSVLDRTSGPDSSNWKFFQAVMSEPERGEVAAVVLELTGDSAARVPLAIETFDVLCQHWPGIPKVVCSSLPLHESHQKVLDGWRALPGVQILSPGQLPDWHQVCAQASGA